jgi:hypothetical protein
LISASIFQKIIISLKIKEGTITTRMPKLETKEKSGEERIITMKRKIKIIIMIKKKEMIEKRISQIPKI